MATPFGAFSRFLECIGGDRTVDPGDARLVANKLRIRRTAFALSEFQKATTIAYPFFRMLPLYDSLESLEIGPD
jgi:hypothetical protein